MGKFKCTILRYWRLLICIYYSTYCFILASWHHVQGVLFPKYGEDQHLTSYMSGFIDHMILADIWAFPDMGLILFTSGISWKGQGLTQGHTHSQDLQVHSKCDLLYDYNNRNSALHVDNPSLTRLSTFKIRPFFYCHGNRMSHKQAGLNYKLEAFGIS